MLLEGDKLLDHEELEWTDVELEVVAYFKTLIHYGL
jgi:hypothetical protein